MLMHKMLKTKRQSTSFLKKTILLFSASILLLAIFAAADWTIQDSITLGSASQDRGVSASRTITITNTDPALSIENITASFSKTTPLYSAAELNVTIINIPSQIAPNASADITVSGFVPLSFDSGSRQIGTISLAGASNSTLLKTVAVFMEAKSNLDIDDVELDISGDNERVSDGETIDAKRGDSITLTLKIENLFSTSTDIDINDITVTVENDALDIDDDTDLGDLGPRDDDEATLSFDIPDDADDGRETVTITAEGEDDNGAVHTTVFEFDFDVEVERYDLDVADIRFSPATGCIGQSVKIDVELENTGLRDLDEAVIYVTSEDLNFNKKIQDIVIDEGDTETVSTTMNIPGDVDPGSYFVTVETFYQEATSAKRDEETQTITVRDCAKPPTTTPPPTTGTNQTGGFEVVTTPPITGGVTGVPVTKKESFFETNAFLLMLAFTNVLVIILIIVILVASRKKY